MHETIYKKGDSIYSVIAEKRENGYLLMLSNGEYTYTPFGVCRYGKRVLCMTLIPSHG